MAVVMATHNMELVRKTRDVRVLELKDGQLISDSAVTTEQISSASEAGSVGSPPTSGLQTSVLSESHKNPVSEAPKGSPPGISYESASDRRQNNT